MNRLLTNSLAIVAVSLMVFPWVFAYPQDEEPDKWVYLTVTVVSEKGNPVMGLASGDFEIREEGKPCQIESFSTNDEPATIGFLIDTSGSMKESWVQSEAALKTLLADFMERSHPDSEYFVVSLSDKAQLLQDLTRDHQRVLEAMATEARGRTALFDAIDLGIIEANQRSGKRVLIVFSDGLDNVSKTSFQRLKQVIGETNSLIYAFYTKNKYVRSSQEGASGWANLRIMTGLTGGQVLFPQDATELVGSFRQLAAELRHQYEIGFVPAPFKKREWRRITVKVREKPGLGKLKVRARQRYIVTP